MNAPAAIAGLADDLRCSAPERCAETECRCLRCETIAELDRLADRLRRWEAERDAMSERRSA